MVHILTRLDISSEESVYPRLIFAARTASVEPSRGCLRLYQWHVDMLSTLDGLQVYGVRRRPWWGALTLAGVRLARNCWGWLQYQNNRVHGRYKAALDREGL